MSAKHRQGLVLLRPQLSREGLVFFLLTVGIFLGAFNTGHNLLFLLASAMLALWLVQLMGGLWTMRGLEVKRQLPASAIAGEQLSVGLELSSRPPLKGIKFSLLEVFKGTERLPDLEIGEERARATRSEYDFVAPRSGVLGFSGVVVSSGFPFGFLHWRGFVTLAEELVIWPRSERVIELPDGALGTGGGAIQRHQASDEMDALRELRPNEVPRRIAWKPSAKRRRWIVVDELRAAKDDKELELCFLAVADDPLAPRLDAIYECAASLARRLAERGQSFYLRGLGQPQRHFTPSELDQAFSYIATSGYCAAEALPQVLRDLPQPGAGVERVVILDEQSPAPRLDAAQGHIFCASSKAIAIK